MNRRNLSRAFAAAVAVAALFPLFAADPNGCARRSVPARAFHQLPAQTPDPLHPH